MEFWQKQIVKHSCYHCGSKAIHRVVVEKCSLINKLSRAGINNSLLTRSIFQHFCLLGKHPEYIKRLNKLDLLRGERLLIAGKIFPLLIFNVFPIIVVCGGK